MSKRKLEAAKLTAQLSKKGKKQELTTEEITKENHNSQEELVGAKQRTLIFANRGISGHGRHLMNDLRLLVPNCKKHSKLDNSAPLYEINELCRISACNNCVFFEQRGKQFFMWVAKAPNGPSAKFLVLNVHTMDELKMTGNCLRGSRPFMFFDSAFEKLDHTKLIKQMFIQAFSTPKWTVKSKPFIDHVFAFFYQDDRLWFRNFQVVEQEAGKKMELALNEIGPRFILKLVRIHTGSFSGPILYENPKYENPALKRIAKRQLLKAQVMLNQKTKERQEKRKQEMRVPLDPLDNYAVFG